jgi:(2Fe-2S) ferredoxin
MPKPPVLDVWICQGRMCTSHGADRVKAAISRALAEREDSERGRVLRGGCYGLCDFGPNVVARRYASEGRRPSAEADRLSLTRRKNETVYSAVSEDEVVQILSSHLDDDEPAAELTHAEREKERPAENETDARIRKLRRKTA